jgi:hypothetical protein
MENISTKVDAVIDRNRRTNLQNVCAAAAVELAAMFDAFDGTAFTVAEIAAVIYKHVHGKTAL